MDINEYDIACTAAGCKKVLPPESMWLPEWNALAAANGGRRVPVSDYPKHALCGRHGHELRQLGVRVYRYSVSVERAEETERGRYERDYLVWWQREKRMEFAQYELDYLAWWESRNAAGGSAARTPAPA